MTTPRIIIATTFRDFSGSENDQIQNIFLESLKAQTYRNWELAVTIYNERSVEKTLKSMAVPAKFFKGKKGDFRFSHSEVLLNGLAVSDQPKDIILWTTCDVIFQDNFLQMLIDQEYDACTSHPHFLYPSVEFFNKRDGAKLTIEEGIDSIAFHSDFLGRKGVIRQLQNYKFTDWGIFEHFLVAVSAYGQARMINLWGASNISKIVNDRKVTKDGKAYLENSWNRNYVVFIKFLNTSRLSHDFLNLIFIHSRFTPIKKLKYYQAFLVPRMEYFISSSQITNIFRRVVRRFQ